MKYNLENLLKQYVQGEKLKYLFFWGHQQKDENIIDKSCFSQWFEASFIVNHIEYKTAEHWMMAKKAELFQDSEIIHKIINCSHPDEAKKLGRKVKGFDYKIWNEHKFDIVMVGNIFKFHQNLKLLEFLLKTNNRILVEASPYDKIWGIGMSKNHPRVEHPIDWKGENLLGFALMEVRDILKEPFQWETDMILPPWIYFESNSISKKEESNYIEKFKEYIQSLDEISLKIFKIIFIPNSDWTYIYE